MLKIIRNTLAILLLLTVPAYAGGAMGLMVAAGSSAATACSTPSGDELSEGFEDNTGWTAVTLVENTNLFYNHVLQGDGPTGSCGTGVTLQLTSTLNRERIHYDLGSTMDADVEDVTIKFSIYFNSCNVAGSAQLYILGVGSTNEGGLNNVSLVNSGGNYYLRGNAGASNSTSALIATGTWYTVTLFLDASDAATSYFKIDEVATCDAANECAFTRSTTDCQYVVVGKNAADADYADFEIGYLTVQTD